MEKYKSQAAQSRNSTAEATRSSAWLRSGEHVFENGPASDGSSAGAVLNVPLVKQRLAALLAQLVLHHRLALPRPLGCVRLRCEYSLSSDSVSGMRLSFNLLGMFQLQTEKCSHRHIIHEYISCECCFRRGVEDRESNGSESELVHLLRFLQAETACFKEAALAVSLQDAIRLCTPIPDPMYVVCVYSYRFMGTRTRTYGICTGIYVP